MTMHLRHLLINMPKLVFAGAVLAMLVMVPQALRVIGIDAAWGEDAPSFTVRVAPSSQSVIRGEAATYTMTVQPVNGYIGTVNLNIQACPSGATCIFADGASALHIEDANPRSIDFTIATSATGTAVQTYSNITATAEDLYDDALQQSAIVSLTVTEATGFSFSAANLAPSSLSISEGTSQTMTVSVTPLGDFGGPVTVGWSLHPTVGSQIIAITSSPDPLTLPVGNVWNGSVTVSAKSGSAGSYTLDFTATAGEVQRVVRNIPLIIATAACTSCDAGATCTVDGCKIDPTPNASSCNADTCYNYDPATGAQVLKNPAPEGCWASWPACQNLNVLKVRKDRQCNQWLDCKTLITQTDKNNNTVTQCSELGLCVQMGANGQCAKFLTKEPDPQNQKYSSPQDVNGVDSQIRWYSGYSSGFHFSDSGTIQSTYKPNNIAEAGLGGATPTDLVNNGTFENLTCIGGPRDRQPCIVPSDCRVGGGVCVDVAEGDGPVGVSSGITCTSNKDCAEAKAGTIATPHCRYITSWGTDVLCRNPLDAQWLGIVAPNSAPNVEEAGFGYADGDTNYEGDIQSGVRRNASNRTLVRWRVWEDNANLADQQQLNSTLPGYTQDPRFPVYAPEKHLKDGNNQLKVELQGEAPAFTGVGEPITQQLDPTSQYTVTFKYRMDPATTSPVGIKAQLAVNYERVQAVGTATYGGYQKNTGGSDTFQDFGVIAGRYVCSQNPAKTCSLNSDCGTGTCVDTTQWQEFVMGPLSAPSSYVSAQTPFLNFVNDRALGSSPMTFYLDDVTLRPALNPAREDHPGDLTESPLVKIGRNCRAFPSPNALDCQYADPNGTLYRGWRGYCLDKDPKNASLCLTWWPLDILSGEGGLVADQQGYTGPSPLFYCAEQEGGPFYVDMSDDTKDYGFDIEDYAENSLTVDPDKRIRLRDVERIDFLFDADDETSDGNDWSDPPGLAVAGAADFDRRGPCENDTGECGGSRIWLQADLSKYKRIPTDDGFRLMAQVFGEDVTGREVAWDQLREDSCRDSKNWVAALFHFTGNDPNDPNAVLDRIDWKLCDSRNNTMEGDQYFRFIVRARQSCNVVVQTVDSSKSPSDKAWTNRLNALSQYRVPGLDLIYGSDAPPYGAIAPPYQSQPPTWGSWTASATGAIDPGIQALEPGTGAARAGTAYSYRQDPHVGSSVQQKYCYDATAPLIADEGVNNPQTSNPESPEMHLTNRCEKAQGTDNNITTCQGYGEGSACIGRPVKRCSGNPAKACSEDKDCRGYGDCIGTNDAGWSVGNQGALHGIERLKHVFAKGYGCWKLNAELVDGDGNPDTKGSKVVMGYEGNGTCEGLPGGGTWDVINDCAGTERPSVNGCNAGDENCLRQELCRVRPTATIANIQGQTSGDIRVSVNDRINVKLEYAVDKEQQPAKQYKMNWRGESCESNANPWLAAPRSPFTLDLNLESTRGAGYSPRFCIKDNWGAIDEDVYDGRVYVSD